MQCHCEKWFVSKIHNKPENHERKAVDLCAIIFVTSPLPPVAPLLIVIPTTLLHFLSDPTLTLFPLSPLSCLPDTMRELYNEFGWKSLRWQRETENRHYRDFCSYRQLTGTTLTISMKASDRDCAVPVTSLFPPFYPPPPFPSTLFSLSPVPIFTFPLTSSASNFACWSCRTCSSRGRRSVWSCSCR